MNVYCTHTLKKGAHNMMAAIEMTPEEVYALLNQGAINDAQREIQRIDIQIAQLLRRREEVEREVSRRYQKGALIRSIA